MFGDDEAPQHLLPILKSDKKPIRQARNRRQSQASSAFSESSASGLAVESPKPRKRGRKPKKQPKEEKTTGQDEELDDDDLPKDPRRRRILERNRIAATKCRLRKRDEASALASREQAMEDQNRYLSTCFDSLTAEIYHLKTQLLRHTDCNCKLIQKYIANEAQKSVDGLLACSSAFHSYGGSMSPDYGSSSGASTTESLNMPPSEPDGLPPTWTNSFQEGHKASFSDNMFDVGLDPFQKAAMPPDSMVSSQAMSNLPHAGYIPGLYVNIGPHEHQQEIAWNTHWQIR
ncbi:Fc.00g070750.m01.CDS01 [Cosmosporella sp. VM-42]